MKKNEVIFSRRHFLKQLGMLSGALMVGADNQLWAEQDKKYTFNISLAQWSLHKAFFTGTYKALDFPEIARTRYDISAVEYVNQFFKDKARDQNFLADLKQRAKDQGVKSLLIMIDGEGDLAGKEAQARKQAVENHYKWVEAAAFLGCHSIRVNLHGEGTAEEWTAASAESLAKLTEFSAPRKINVIVENHGGFSCNGKRLVEVMQKVNHPRCGTLPDFGNFCVRREKGDLWESPCVEWYDRYKGVEEMLPYAKGVSAKSLDFDAQGNETTIDYRKMLKLLKAANYKGYVGIEYEGERLSEDEGIKATKRLLEQVGAEL